MSKQQPPLVVDFEAVLDELRRHGFSARAIASHIGVSHVSVLGYREGAVPQFNIGERLVALWCGVTNKTVEQLPRMRELPSASKASSW
jgi:hypothetical protein